MTPNRVALLAAVLTLLILAVTPDRHAATVRLVIKFLVSGVARGRGLADGLIAADDEVAAQTNPTPSKE